jgi:putative IMPACT (imprinted ancient) family translation regulator
MEDVPFSYRIFDAIKLRQGGMMRLYGAKVNR